MISKAIMILSGSIATLRRKTTKGLSVVVTTIATLIPLKVAQFIYKTIAVTSIGVTTLRKGLTKAMTVVEVVIPSITRALSIKRILSVGAITIPRLTKGMWKAILVVEHGIVSIVRLRILPLVLRFGTAARSLAGRVRGKSSPGAKSGRISPDTGAKTGTERTSFEVAEEDD